MMLLALLLALGGAWGGYKVIDRSWETKKDLLTDKKEACENVDKAQKQVDNAVKRNDWRLKDRAEELVAICDEAKEAHEKHTTLWIIAFGIILSGLAMAQVLLYRAGRLRAVKQGRYPVTPLLVEVVRAIGECAAAVVTIHGVFSGIQSIFISEKLNSILPGGFRFVEHMGLKAIVLAPIVGFMMLLFTHFFAELAVAVVAIANNTTPSDKS